MTCSRCGLWTERYTVEQTRCRRCEADVQRLIESDTARRAPRFAVAKSLDGWRAA